MQAIAAIDAAGETMATRKASLVALNAFAPSVAGAGRRIGRPDRFQPDQARRLGAGDGDDATGNYLYFGVREFGMSAICNGMRCTAASCPYSGTFLTCSPTMRATRCAWLR